MPYCRNAPDPTRRPGRALALAFLLGMAVGLTPAAASVIEPRPETVRLQAGEDAYVLSAEFNIDLGPHLEDIVMRGVPLYFQLEVEITRDRWFWPGQHVAGRVYTYRLAYTPLSRQYRLTSGGGLTRDFAKLTDALRAMGRAAALPVAERGALKPGETYEAALRLSLDRQKLPKPLQLDAIADKSWSLETKVLRWSFVPVAIEREAR